MKGESFYNPYIPDVLEEFNKEGLIKESDGARVVEIKGHNIPLIVIKRDGGYNYASTDLAALWLVCNILFILSDKMLLRFENVPKCF